MDPKPNDLTIEEKISSISSPRDFLNLYRNQLESSIAAADPLGKDYEQAMQQGKRGVAITIGEKINAITSSMIKNNRLIKERIALLYPDANSAIGASSSLDKEDQLSFVTLWEHAKAEQEQKA
jgi:hypothetical protein